MVTHNIEFAVDNIPRTILMANGKIIADGPTNKLLINDMLVQEASLILPQIHQFKTQLIQVVEYNTITLIPFLSGFSSASRTSITENLYTRNLSTC